MPESHADSHDRDKLDRWRQGLEQDEPGSFPVCAVFLVSEIDQNAHDFFRKFRDSFERKNAGFHHLVIFGQHGVSTTVRALLAELGLPAGHLPCLLMASGAQGEEVAVFQLPSGNGPEVSPEASIQNEAPTPETLLAQVESVIDGGAGKLRLVDVPGGITRDLGGRTLAQLADALAAQI